MSATKKRDKQEKDKEESLVQELSNLLTRLEQRLAKAREAHQESLVVAAAAATTPSPTATRTATPPRLGRLFRRKSRDEPSPASATTTTAAAAVNDSTSSASPSPSPSRSASSSPRRRIWQQQQAVADFVPFPEQDEFVEDLRRASELCVIGEGYVSRVERRQREHLARQKEKWTAARDALSEHVDESECDLDGRGPRPEDDDRMHLFDLFFERGALEMIVDMLAGDSFRLVEPKGEEHGEEERGDEAAATKTNGESKTKGEETSEKEEATPQKSKSDAENKTLLPPLPIAMQALQSISILIQNVSRATSLYVILSNNYINKLIDLPLDLYAIAERRRMMATKEYKRMPHSMASTGVTEVMTQFVTFLKSLAMRINVETLQFFLKYPNESSKDGGESRPASAAHFYDSLSSLSNHSKEEDVAALIASMDPHMEGHELKDMNKPVNVEFPLYERALHFCAAYHDTFVRTTAMNICLNVLRLTTVQSKQEEHSSEDESSEEREIGSSPDGVLHNARALPFRERLAIAQFACIPSRVDRLISPIFTKLAERWNALDEQIRSIDSNKHMGVEKDGVDAATARNEKVAKAKEKVRRERLLRALQDRAADLQDELLLLDDVFRVGLTVLNEQMIEMILATFVYPLLLQPLLLYYQRLDSALDESTRISLSDHPFGESGNDLSDVDKSLRAVSGPAKAALFTLASAFQFLSNCPLLRLLYTVLFHPLSPDATSTPTVRSKLEVATVDREGRRSIRLDRLNPAIGPESDERATYAFGTSPTNRRISRLLAESDEKTEACVFVLSPALAEILEFKGDDIALMSRTKPNPYRRALLKCLTLPDDMSDVRKLAVCTFDSALSALDGSFSSDILFGTDLKTFADDIPADERNQDSKEAHTDVDRGLGGSVKYESRQSLGRQIGGPVGTDLTSEVVTALCTCVVFAERVTDEWKLSYDEVATHALLSAIRRNPKAIVVACKSIEKRWRQASLLLARNPHSGLGPMGGSSIFIPGSPSVNADDYNEQMFGSLMNLVFYDKMDVNGAPAADEFVQLKSTEPNLREGLSTSISTVGNFDSLCNSVGGFLLLEEGDFGSGSFDREMVEERRHGACSFFRVDALLSLLRDMAATGGIAMRDGTVGGIAVSPDGSIIHFAESFGASDVYANVSRDVATAVFSRGGDGEQPEARSTIHLVGSPAIPCVCEAPPSTAALFSDDVSGVIAEGVTWQSLYLVFLRGFLIFAQPLPGESGGDGRVVTSCALERLWVEPDPEPPTDGSPARRLLLYYKWFDKVPPGLFLFDDVPTSEEFGPFYRVKPFTSRLDVWFEDGRAADHAYQILTTEIFKAKSQRGNRLASYLDPQHHHQRSW